MTDLATALSAPLSTVTRIIDRLENKQMVERFRSLEDRRIVIVKESEKGKVLREHFDIVPVRAEAEGARITLTAGFDAAAVKLTGNVVGQPPFSGSLSHRGWRVAEVRLPKLAEGHDARVLAPAEVEL